MLNRPRLDRPLLRLPVEPAGSNRFLKHCKTLMASMMEERVCPICFAKIDVEHYERHAKICGGNQQISRRRCEQKKFELKLHFMLSLPQQDDTKESWLSRFAKLFGGSGGGAPEPSKLPSSPPGIREKMESLDLGKNLVICLYFLPSSSLPTVSSFFRPSVMASIIEERVCATCFAKIAVDHYERHASICGGNHS